MSKPFLIIQLRPEDAAADGELDAILRHGGLDAGNTVRLRAERDGMPESPAQVQAILQKHCAIIVGGSPFDVSSEESAKSDTQKAVEAGFTRLFDGVVEQDFPFLGCCSGNGLLGSYLGAGISGRYSEDVGAADVEVTEDGKKDPLLQGVPSRFRVLLGHKEACDQTPPGSVLLAKNDACPVQMFRAGENVYATQFHPEGDPQGFRVRIGVYRDYGYFPADTADKLADSIAHEKTHHAHKILRNFVERYGG